MQAVMFDWRGTLVDDPPIDWWLRRAFATVARTPATGEIGGLSARVEDLLGSPEHREAEASMDCDPALHRTATMRLFEAAGMDAGLAEALYALDLDPDCHPVFPDTPTVLRRLREAGIRTSIVSDIHFDLRPELDQRGLLRDLDDVVLSFEHGIQKPDPRIFELALDRLGMAARDALMVGDRASRDGGAVAVGIATILIPTLPRSAPGRFDLVLRAAGLTP